MPLSGSAVLWALLCGSRAEAAGYYLTGAGARPIGRAGAVVVGVDDLSAQRYNPAALIRMQRPRLNLQLAGVHQAVGFERQDESELSFDEVRNGDLPFVIPNLGYAHPIIPEKLVVAVGFSSPYAPTLGYPEDGPQRFTLTSSRILSGQLGPSVAWSPFEGFSIGGSLFWTFLSLDQALVTGVNPAGFQASDDPIYDIPTRIQASDFAQMTGNIGVLYDRGVWGIAASFAPPIRFEAQGSLTSDFSKNIYYTGGGSVEQLVIQEQASDEDVTLPLTLPPVARLGVLWRPSERLELELDGVWQGWSSLESLTLQDINMEIETIYEDPARVNGDVTLPASLKDSFSVNFGAEGRLMPRWQGRAGLYWESSAAADGYASVLLPEGDKFGYGLGSSIKLGRGIWLDIGWGQGIAPAQDITSSNVYQILIDPVSGDVRQGKVVGRGRLWVLNSVAALGLNWSFGEPKEG